MWRRCTIAVAAAGLASMAGCGLINSSVMTHEAHRPGAVSRTFDAPVNRLLVAAHEAAEVEPILEVESTLDFLIYSVRWDPTVMGATVDPANPKFDIEDITIGSGSIVGKAKDGRDVTLWLLERDHGRKTEVSLLVGKQGDLGLSNAYLDRVADKLAHPSPGPKNAAWRKTIVKQAAEKIANSIQPAPAATKEGTDR